MKKSIIIFLSLMFGFSVMASAQPQNAPQWTGILGSQPATFSTQLLSSSENSIQVNVQVPGFYMSQVTTPRGEAFVISVPKSVSTAQAGEPNVPMTGIPVMIGDQARMSARIVKAQYKDFENIEVAPSKGDFPRSIDPATVPYTYGECYSQDAFFPANSLDLYEPYIIRDFRGQNMAVFPFAYNPVTKTLRVYYDMIVEMYKVDDKGKNVIQPRRSNTVKMDPDFKSVYQRHFINFEASTAKYTPVDEEGDLLIICYDNYISAMTDFVNWKKTRGVNTTIVGTSTAGTTAEAIKTYIQNQYNANNNLTHVLLVGDVAQIPGYSYSGGGNYYSGLGDNPYGQVVGDDIYNDLFIGRFSASSTARVATQCNRVISYERDLTLSATWCRNGLGVSTDSDPDGHYNERDYQHIENLRNDLLGFGYSTVYQDYYQVENYPSSSTTTISDHINDGVGIINYCNHGSQTAWQSHNYSNSHVNALTNDNKLPFIFSVACLNGKYDYSSDCFAEAWMNATNNINDNPTGAIGGMFSYISQPWIPPMWAQDEFVDIITEQHSNKIKHTSGGAAINSLFAIFDNYSTSTSAAVGTYQAWIHYGDPSLMLRTKTPQAMTVTHAGFIKQGTFTYTVNVSNGDGAVATITDAEHNILGKATVSNGTANFSINNLNLTAGTELTLCVFGYNKMTHLGTITVEAGTQYSKPISAYTEHGGYYLIASPIGTISPEYVTNMLTNTYDLYRFNQTANIEWENYKNTTDHPDFTTMESGKGYLYANSNNVVLNFTGTPYSGNGAVTLSKTEGVTWSGWNLIGNPFGTAATLNKPFYKMNTEGTALSAQVEANNNVTAMEGVFVQASTNNETATFTQVNNSKGSEKNDVPLLNVNLVSIRGAIDNAIIRFDGGQTLGKFTLHEDDSKIYIPQGGEDYAITNADTQGELPLNLKVTKNGTYTLTIKPEGMEMNYLHLIDNLTGNDVNLLVPEPVEGPASYTFQAKTTDYESRFRLVFAPVCEDADGDNDSFAFFNDGNIIVNDGPSTGSGTYTLQVVDMMGRVVICRDAARHVSTNGMAPGVYVLRLINGDNVRTQKIVVR